MSQTEQAQNIDATTCGICSMQGHITRNCNNCSAAEVIRKFYNLFAINEYIYVNSPVDFTTYKNKFTSSTEATKYCLTYKCRFKKYDLEFLYYFLRCYEDEYERRPRVNTYTKQMLAQKIVSRFNNTSDEERYFNYTIGEQNCVFSPNYERNKAFAADQFDKILTGQTLSHVFKIIIKTPLEIIRDIRVELRRQHNEEVLRRVEQPPVQNPRPQQQVPRTPPIQNPRPQQQVPRRPPTPPPSTTQPQKFDLRLQPLPDEMLPNTPKECSICLDQIEKDKMCYLNCNHFFHLNCIVAMCSSKTACSKKCPMCRVEVKRTFVSKPAFVNYFIEKKKMVVITI